MELLRFQTNQVSIISGFLLFSLNYFPITKVFKGFLKTTLNIQLKDIHQQLLESIIFALIALCISKFVFQVLFKNYEGLTCAKGYTKGDTNECEPKKNIDNSSSSCILHDDCNDNEFCNGIECKIGARSR